MTHKLSNTDKIEVEAGDLRTMIGFMENQRFSNTAETLRNKYLSAFVKEPELSPEEWEDVTATYAGLYDMVEQEEWRFKIENNRIYRCKG